MRLLKLVLAASVAATGLLVAPAAAPTSAAGQGNGGHPECVDHDSIEPGGTTPAYGEVWIKVGADGDHHGHYSIGVKEAGFVIPTKFDVPGDKEKDVSHADVCEQTPPPPPEMVTPEAPSFTDPTCENPTAGLQLPDTDGITYTVTGDGDDGADPGETVTVTATATADDGYQLDDGDNEWIHTYPALDALDCDEEPPPPETVPPEPTIDVAAFSPVCQADIPYIDWNIEVTGTPNTTATITFIDNTGSEILTLDDQPFQGQVLYPGANDDPADWPGWRLEDGRWVPDGADEHWRDGLAVRVEVNPTATAEVTYPPATASCHDPEIVASAPPPLPPTTGSPSPDPETVESAPPSPPATGSASPDPETVESAPPSPPATGSASPDPEAVELPKTGTTSTLVIAGIATLLVLGGTALLRLQSRPRRVRD